MLDFDRHHREVLPPRCVTNLGRLAAGDVRGVPAIAFRLPDGRAYRFEECNGAIAIAPGADAPIVVEVDLSAWRDFVGEMHDLAENIIHLVLARIEGAPQGTKGISLFIVPKFLVNADGSLGKRNGVVCGKIEEKMGIHGNSTCVLNYDDAVGYLIGQENKGLAAMFTMMNVARLGVGLQGLAQSEVAYQNGVVYAKDRIQGRSITGAKAPDRPADPIIVHPDIRRMLMDAKSFNEAARAFAYWTAIYGDLLTVSPDEKVREKAAD